MKNDCTYIEVTGSADYTEEVDRYVAELQLSARAAAGEVALAEAAELRTRVIERLRESGLQSDELIEGGMAAWSPWFWKKKVGQEAFHKIIVKCGDLGQAGKPRCIFAFDSPSPQRPERF